MSLVSYAYSDSEDDDDRSKADSAEVQHSATAVQVEQSSSDQDSNNSGRFNSSTDQTRSSSFNLPPPKATTSGLLVSAGSSLRNAVHTKKGNKVRILLPSFKNQPEDEVELDDQEETSDMRKRRLASSSGCGLTSMLPPPKKNKITSGSQKLTSFVPNSLRPRPSPVSTRPTSAKSKPVTLVTNVQVDSEDNEETESFFSFEKRPNYAVPEKSTIDLAPSTAASSSSSAAPLDFSVRPDESEDEQTDLEPTNKLHNQLDEQSRLRRLIERKFGDHVDQDLTIVDVDMSQHLNHNIDYLKSMSEERDQSSAGPMPSGQAKRKHQITYLAYQAKQNEIKLKNEWAKNRNTKSQAKARYGF
jgi:hypothetical protein